MKEDANKEEKIYSSQFSRPVRIKKTKTAFISDFLLPYFPDLKKKLYLASMKETPAEFLNKAVNSAILVSIALTIVLAVLLNARHINILIALILFPVILLAMFFYIMLYPEAKIIKRQRDIDTELVFAGRHILIALRAGMPLFDTLVGVSNGYGVVSEEFRKIVEKINLGVPMGQAIRESSINSPSNSFARISMQLANAISSGADIASSLEVVLNQISKEQAISLKAYGQKLNPLIMFYMIFGIIFPSLGVAFAIILFSLVSSGAIGLNPTSLIYAFVVTSLIQFLFLSVVENARPRYLL